MNDYRIINIFHYINLFHIIEPIIKLTLSGRLIYYELFLSFLCSLKKRFSKIKEKKKINLRKYKEH